MTRAGRIDLVRHLELFVSIAEEGHIGRAADRLDMSQPPLSQALRRLEERLGATLFERTARGVELTAAGADLLPRAEALLDVARSILDPAERAPAALRIGVASPVPNAVIACLAAGLDDGGGSLQVATAPTVELLDGVGTGRLDLAVVTHPAAVADLAAGPIVRLPTRVLVPAGEASSTVPVSLRSLRHLTLVLPARADNPAWHDAVADVAETAGVKIGHRVAGDDRAAVALVAGGGCMAITVERHDAVPGVAAVDLADDPLPLRLRAVWRGDGRVELGARAVALMEELG